MMMNHQWLPLLLLFLVIWDSALALLFEWTFEIFLLSSVALVSVLKWKLFLPQI
jgi:hypothetical protein